MNIAKDAMKLVKQDAIPFAKEGFSTCSPVYLATTSHVKNTLGLYDGYRDVLAICSTGAHAYEALLHGARCVDVFDINQLQLIYFLFMKTAITVLPYEEFVLYFSLGDSEDLDTSHLLSVDLYSKLEEFLDDDVKKVLGPIYKNFTNEDIVYSRMVRFHHDITLSHLKDIASFYNEKDYYKLQSILRSNPNCIRVYPFSLEDVPKKVDGSYDLILLDNVLDYYSGLSINTPYKVDQFIKGGLSCLLRDGGRIQSTYSYGFDTDYFSSVLNGSREEEVDDEEIYFGAIPMGSFFKRLIDTNIDSLEKENLTVPLYQDFGGYQYSIFDGVDSCDGKNMVLTYTKKS